MLKISLLSLSIIFGLNLYSQNFKGLDDFEKIHVVGEDTLVEFRKVYAVKPEGGAEYWYAMPSTPSNIDIIFNFTKDILKLNFQDIEKPTHNHNKDGEAWITYDGFEEMSKQTWKYFKMVRREWIFNVGWYEENMWYVHLEVMHGHIYFRAGPAGD
tara:strand:+ start:42 stop:509 length:468 start_codon:yes stop_codon:yes gene_type:complete